MQLKIAKAAKHRAFSGPGGQHSFHYSGRWLPGRQFRDESGRPHVAGAAALVLSAHPHLTVQEIKAALLGSVDPVASLRGKVITGGTLNLARALEFAARSDTPPIVIYASPAGQRNSPTAPIAVAFNHSMDRASVEAALRITPSLAGVFDWDNDCTSFRYVHAGLNSGTNYTVRILGSAQDATGRTLDGNFNQKLEGSPTDDFVWTFRFPLLNDAFATAQAITDSSGTTIGSNRYALIELNEPNHADSPSSGASVWYSWTPPVSGWYTFDLTSGTGFDSLLAVYTGDALEQLAPVAANDNYGSRQSSRTSFEAAAGRRYSIAVAAKSASDGTQAGSFTLTWYPTPHAGFTGSQFSPLSGAPGTKITLTGTNFAGATAVLFNGGVSANFTNAPTNNFDLRITAIVPPDATSGPITIISPHGSVSSTATFQVLRPVLALMRNSGRELTLSWTDTNFILESTIDLRTWVPAAPPGSSNAVVELDQHHAFFRLHGP